MNGLMQRWLGGALLTLGLALACASVGCVAPDDPDSETDADTEEVDTASQELEEAEVPAPPGNQQESTRAPDVNQGAVNDGSDSEPQPVPWKAFVTSPVPDDVGDPVDPVGTPQNAVSSTSQPGK